MKTALALVLLLAACPLVCLSLSSCLNDDDILSLDGVVQFVDVEGGCWRIHGNNGVNYEPTNLPKDFQEDGLAVRFTAKEREDLVSTCQVGRIIELIRIKRLSG